MEKFEIEHANLKLCAMDIIDLTFVDGFIASDNSSDIGTNQSNSGKCITQRDYQQQLSTEPKHEYESDWDQSSYHGATYVGKCNVEKLTRHTHRPKDQRSFEFHLVCPIRFL